MELTSDIDEATQAELDKKYEDLMEKLKTINLRLYKRLRANEKVGFEKNVDIIINEDEQFEMSL
jgi:hypothetical protein|tara:strand:- start:2534 stop:2725 length:192 start_codon:yes stop_codon:yes gene_type:complete